MLITPCIDSNIQIGTYFWGQSDEMRSQHSSSDRPLVVFKIIDGIAFCCPTSSKSDAWNEQNASHVIPKELNEWVMCGKDSYFAVNRVCKEGFVHVSLDEIANKSRRIVLPEGFLLMGQQLLAEWQVVSKEVKSRFDAPLSKSIKKSNIARVPVVTHDIMVSLGVQV